MSKRSIFFILLMVFVGLVFSYSFIRDGKTMSKIKRLKMSRPLKPLKIKLLKIMVNYHLVLKKIAVKLMLKSNIYQEGRAINSI